MIFILIKKEATLELPRCWDSIERATFFNGGKEEKNLIKENTTSNQAVLITNEVFDLRKRSSRASLVFKLDI